MLGAEELGVRGSTTHILVEVVSGWVGKGDHGVGRVITDGSAWPLI